MLALTTTLFSHRISSMATSGNNKKNNQASKRSVAKKPSRSVTLTTKKAATAKSISRGRPYRVETLHQTTLKGGKVLSAKSLEELDQLVKVNTTVVPQTITLKFPMLIKDIYCLDIESLAEIMGMPVNSVDLDASDYFDMDNDKQVTKYRDLEQDVVSILYLGNVEPTEEVDAMEREWVKKIGGNMKHKPVPAVSEDDDDGND